MFFVVTAGIVAEMSDPIASAQISEYYLSSFYYGHTMVSVSICLGHGDILLASLGKL